MKNSKVFKNIVKDINSELNEISPRGLKVRELINYKAVLKPYNLAFDFNSRMFSWKYLAAELLWYLSGDLESKNIGKYASLWNRISEDGFVNSNYGYIVFIRYIKDYYNQYNYVLNNLKQDKNSRQAIIRYNDDKHAYKDNKDFVCTLGNQFLIRDNKLHIIVTMRSNDIFYGLQYDLVRFGLLQQSIRLDLLDTYPNLELGNIYHNVGSIHFYEPMFDIANKIEKEKGVDYKIILNKSLYDGHKLAFQNDILREKLSNTKDYKGFIEKYFNINITNEK